MAAWLRQSRLMGTSTASVTLNPKKFARLPARCFAGLVFFEELGEFLPVGMTFIDEVIAQATILTGAE